MTDKDKPQRTKDDKNNGHMFETMQEVEEWIQKDARDELDRKILHDVVLLCELCAERDNQKENRDE